MGLTGAPGWVSIIKRGIHEGLWQWGTCFGVGSSVWEDMLEARFFPFSSFISFVAILLCLMLS